MNNNLIEELVKLSRDISNQENLNRQNIFETLKIVEKIIKEVICLRETVWVDTEIPGQYPNMIFGWSNPESTEPDSGYLVVAQRNTYTEPDSNEEFISGDYPQKVLGSSEVTQKAVYNKLDLLFNKIHQSLKERYSLLKNTEQDIINKIIELQALLHGPTESANGQQRVNIPFSLPNPPKS